MIRNTVIVADTPTITGMFVFMEVGVSMDWGEEVGVTTCNGMALCDIGISVLKPKLCFSRH